MPRIPAPLHPQLLAADGALHGNGHTTDILQRRCELYNRFYGLRQIEAHNPARRTIALDITWRFNEAQKKYRGSGAGQSQKDRM